MKIGTVTSEKVEVLWGDKNPIGLDEPEKKILKPLRVAAYCRVSTELEEQNESFEMQERYYTRIIMSNPAWRLAGIYSDQGISGTQKKHRVGFQRMMRHCEEGKIDQIICKSISRFARNTMDLLDSVRKLQDLGISVIFEKEGIDSLSVQSEFLISTIAAIAQEESRSISENMTWAFTKRFKQGIPVFKRILGYDVSGKGKDKKITINKAEASIVREIFDEFLSGKGYTEIARLMMKKGYKNVRGGAEWTLDTIKGVLTNERYKGDVLCQKTYTEHYLSHKTIRNKGEKKQYYIENHHPAIIERSKFDKVQEILGNSKRPYKYRKKKVYPLSGRLKCGNCGSTLHRYNAEFNPRWICSKRNKDRNLCSGKSVQECDIEKAMMKAVELRYDFSYEFFIHKMKLELKRFQNDDNIERSRVIIKRKIREFMGKSLRVEGDELREIESRLAGLEEELIRLEAHWALVESDREKRKAAIDWLDTLPRNKKKSTAFFEELNINYMRAWVIGIKVLSPISFEIEWFDGTSVQVDL